MSFVSEKYNSDFPFLLSYRQHAALEASAEADVALDVGDNSREAALNLLTGAQDVLTAWLDDQVSLLVVPSSIVTYH